MQRLICITTVELLGELAYGLLCSVIFVNENENENGEKREHNEFVNEN